MHFETRELDSTRAQETHADENRKSTLNEKIHDVKFEICAQIGREVKMVSFVDVLVHPFVDV